MSLFKQKILIIAGPTASGKTSLAQKIAQDYNGVIINIDAFQVYKDLKIISASPLNEDKKDIDYYLYNYLNIDANYSVKIYIQHLIDILKNVVNNDKLIILVGGSNMYIHSLMYGLNDMPLITSEVSEESIILWKTIGQEQFYQKLIRLDDKIIGYIKPLDVQRSIRAYQVKLQTGKSIKDYQEEIPVKPLDDYDVKLCVLNIDRDVLYKNCNERFIKIFDEGGLEEIKNLLPILNKNKYSISNAIGVKELSDYLNGLVSKKDAIEIAQRRTRNFAKRQITWCNNKFCDKIILNDNNILLQLISYLSHWLKA